MYLPKKQILDKSLLDCFKLSTSF